MTQSNCSGLGLKTSDAWFRVNTVLTFTVIFFGLSKIVAVKFLPTSIGGSPTDAILGSLWASATYVGSERMGVYLNLARPQSVLEAKIFNEQLKSFVSLLNFMATTMLALLVIVPVFSRGSKQDYGIYLGIIGCFWLNLHARKLLTMLKDEAADAYAAISRGMVGPTPAE